MSKKITAGLREASALRMELKATHKKTRGRPKDKIKSDAILSAARNAFMSQGLDHVSMDFIASEAGVSKATLYGHFKDKDALFKATIIDVCGKYTTEQHVASYYAMLPKQALETFGLRLYQLIMSHEAVNLYRVMIAESARNPKISALFYEAGPKRVKAYMGDLLKHYHRTKQLRIRNTQDALDQFAALIKGEHHMRVVLGLEKPYGKQKAARHVAQSVALFLRAYQDTNHKIRKSTKLVRP